MQPLADLVRGERPSLPLAPGDDDARRRDPRDAGEADDLPPPHPSP
jgi:hypothetical protein